MRARSRRFTARAVTLALLSALGLATALAGCGGSSDSTSTSSSASSGSASNAAATSGAGSIQLQLVAYSTPKKAYDALIAGFVQTGAGQGVSTDIIDAAARAYVRALSVAVARSRAGESIGLPQAAAG